jgi:hypothetical protein
VRWLALGAVVALSACSGQAPTAPESAAAPPAAAAEGAAGTARALAAAADGNHAPAAVFRTRPRADRDGVIAGGASFDVTFNLCPTTDPDPGDELRFTFDFDGDGTVDELGHCRATHHYEVGVFESRCIPAIACVTDRQPDHRICTSYEICAAGRAAEPTASPSPEPPEVFGEQRISGDFTPIASRDAWAFTGQPGTEVTLELDTVSAATAYWMQGCISPTTRWIDCLRPVAKSRVTCSYPPPGGLGCPHRTTVLPPSANGVYYVIVMGLRFTRNDGEYRAVVRANPGIGALGLILDNGEGETTIEP